MQAVAHNPAFAKKAGVPQSVGKEFTKSGGGMANTKRMNRLEELGRVDSEKAKTSKGKANLMAEKKRIVGEMKFAKGGSIKEARMEPAKMERGHDLKVGNKKFGEHAVQKSGHTRGKNMGDKGRVVGIESGARGMRKGGVCK